MNACTIVSRSSLARARVMAASLHAHQPEASLTALLVDADPSTVNAIPGARLLSLDAVAGGDSGLLAAANPPGALAIALLPYLMRTLFAEGLESVVYVGAGLRVLGRLDDLAALLLTQQSFLVARSVANLASRAAFSGDRARGAFSRELLGLSAGQASTALLSTWPRYFDDESDAGASAVRAWLDSVPALAEDVAVLRNPAYGADPWTLAHQSVGGTAAGLTVENQPVLTFDFSELMPEDPLSLLDGEDRVSPSAAPALARLCVQHAEELCNEGYADDAARPDPLAQLAGGVKLTPTIRGFLRGGIQKGLLAKSPFTGAGREAFLEYLNAPSDRGTAFGLSRLHMAIWDARPDLQSAYPHIDGPDGAGYAGWLCRYGEEQEGLNASVLPPLPEPAFRDADPLIHESPPRWGVNLVGFLTAELGMGEAARLLVAGLDASGIPVSPIQGNLIPPSRQGVEFAFAGPDEAAYPINLLCINGDGIPVFAREAGRAFFEGRYTIAAWWWEVGEPPAEWQRAFEYVDEVWVTSRHVHDLIAPISTVPVVSIPMPIIPPQIGADSRSDLGLPQDGFLFLFVHDYHSVAARKNPVGVIEAFKRAFRPGSGAKLVIKSINAHKLPGDQDRVVLAASDHPDIALIDRYVSAKEKNAMIAQCDCYVSLHRSEGFGLTVAEAMLLGKPVIATRYGGTLEFTNDENAYLVDWQPAEVGDRAGIYAPAAEWAEPNLETAAALMRHVYERPGEAAARGELARRQVSAAHAPAVAGEAMEKRLRHIYDRIVDHGARTLNPKYMPASQAGAGYPEGLGTPPTIDWGHGRMGRLRLRAHRPVAEWVQAYLAHQSSIDAEMFDRLASLDVRVREVVRTLSEEQQARHAETLAVLRRIESELADIRRTTDFGADDVPRNAESGDVES